MREKIEPEHMKPIYMYVCQCDRVLAVAVLRRMVPLLLMGASVLMWLAYLSFTTPNFRTNSAHKYADQIPATDKHCSQEERRKAIQGFCNSHPHLASLHSDPRPSEQKFYVFLVDEKHQMVYCGIPKSGMTLWRTMIAQATGKLNTTGSINISDRSFLAGLGLKFLYHYSEEDQERILKDYFKVMSIRHPLDRLVSAYVDKFTNSYMDDSIVNAVKYVNDTYRSDQNRIFLPKGKASQPTGVEFREFIKLVIDKQAPGDIHWEHMHSICHPCDIHYDYVIRQETMDKDADEILIRLSQGLRERLTLKTIHSHRVDSDVGYYTKHIKEFEDIDQHDLKQLMVKYAGDMGIFGYSFQPSNASLRCGLKGDRSICC